MCNELTDVVQQHSVASPLYTRYHSEPTNVIEEHATINNL